MAGNPEHDPRRGTTGRFPATAAGGLALVFGLALAGSYGASADVWVPDGAYAGFYGSDGIFQVIGVVNNTEIFPVIPAVTITVLDGDKKITRTFEHTSMMPGSEMPFKFAMHEVTGDNPVLDAPELSFIRGVGRGHAIQVIYDDTLVVHPDGHVSGRMANTGTQDVSGARLMAVAHGFEHEMLDVVEAALPIAGMAPGEVLDFAMHPDAGVSGVWYYSCFALGDLSVVTLNAKRDGEIFTIRYESQILISYPEFDESGQSLSLWLNPGWPAQTNLNIEFPRYSDGEAFEVRLNGEDIESIQSLDEAGNWHVAFAVEDQASGALVISGFDPDGDPGIIPGWIKNNAGWWSQGKISDDEFASGVGALVEGGFVQVPAAVSQDGAGTPIPDWFRSNAGWWSQGRISDADYTAGLEYLMGRGVLLIPGAPRGP